ncbi:MULTISPECIES: hypothetical protein [Kamptonema]|nr:MULTISPECIES: hypothetical protein [Kamptonema]CBN59242.1 hypothetical protein OSCI_4100002 [Kamptonema sp. PCC 6506]
MFAEFQSVGFYSPPKFTDREKKSDRTLAIVAVQLLQLAIALFADKAA